MKEIALTKYMVENGVTLPDGSHVCLMEGPVAIPPTIVVAGETCTIAEIASHAFYNNARLTSLTIPDSVTTIGDHAFAGCLAMQGICTSTDNPLIFYDGLPDHITSLGPFAFHECESMTTLALPASINHLPTGLFWDCVSLQSISIPISVGCLDLSIFDGCFNLSEICVSPVTDIVGEVRYNRQVSITCRQILYATN